MKAKKTKRFSYHSILLPSLLTLLLMVIGLLIYNNFFNKPKTIIGQLPDNKLITCPTIKSFCTQTGIIKESSISGNTNPGNQIYAAFDGTLQNITSAQSTKGNKYLLYQVSRLTNQDRKLRALYIYTGTQTNKTTIKEGEVIGTSNAKVIPFPNNTFSFIFILSKITDHNDIFIPITLKNIK